MFVNISNNNPDPLYQQVMEQIKDAIVQGLLEPGSSLPSIRNMAKDLKVSVITIKRAYTDLENHGYIVTRPGLGSFVTDLNKERLKDEKMKEIKEKLKYLVGEGFKFNIEIDDMIKILKELKEDS